MSKGYLSGENGFEVDLKKAALYFLRLKDEKSIQSLKEIIAKNAIPWEIHYHKYWPQKIVSTTVEDQTPKKKFTLFKRKKIVVKYTLNTQIITLFLISKHKRESQGNKALFMSKLVCMVIIKHLTHAWL